MEMSRICSTAEAIQVFLDYLVEPLLPGNTTRVRAAPTESEHLTVAKQVHAAVLLYNYYHRNVHPELKYLGFEPFCRQAVSLTPTLMAYMKFTSSKDSELTDLENQLSLTEKAVMDACNICMSLDTLNDVAQPKEWPISKVAILLIDMSKDSCYLQLDAVTRGVWSVIEKDVLLSKSSSQSTGREQVFYKRRRTPDRPMRDESVADEVGFQKIAFSAVEETTGIDQKDLTIIKSHVVYSLSKEKTAAKFYIICGPKPKKGICIEVPLKDVIDSLQGPLVRLISSQWTFTPVVEYFHMLPYASVLCEWLSRDMLPDSSQNWMSGMVVINPNSSKIKEKQSVPEAHDSKNILEMNSNLLAQEFITDNKSTKKNDNMNIKNLLAQESIIDNESAKNNSGHPTVGLSDGIDDLLNIDIDNSSVDFSGNKKSHPSIYNKVQCDFDLKSMIPYANSQLKGKADHAKVHDEGLNMVCHDVTDCKGGKESDGKVACYMSSGRDQMPILDHALPNTQSYSEDSAKLQSILASKEKILSETALGILYSKRDKLVLQQRNIEDATAQCSKKIQSILSGGEDNLAIKLDSIIEFCNDIGHETAGQHSKYQCSPHYFKRKGLLEEDVDLSFQSSCQELDAICREKHWKLPTYFVSPLDGGFQATVTIKEGKFGCSSEGCVGPSPREARESAAAKVLVKLHGMVEGADLVLQAVSDCKSGKEAGGKLASYTSSGQDTTPILNLALPHSQSNSKDAAKVQSILASKEKVLSKTALRILLSKQDKLVFQHRNIEDDIAECSRKIQTILSGGEEDLAIKIDSIIEFCNDVGLESERTHQQSKYQCLPHYTKRKRLLEEDEDLNIQNSCQELDAICREKIWMLPTYCVSPLDGGFQASARIKEREFECSSEGYVAPSPLEARESAATQVLGKLHDIGKLA